MPRLPARIVGLIVISAALAYSSATLFLRRNRGPSSVDLGFQALQTVSSDRATDAVRYFQDATREDVASSYRWCDLGEAYFLSGDSPHAAYCYRRGLALSPKLPAIRLRMINFLIRSGDSQAAKLLIPSLLSDAPQYEKVLLSYSEKLELTTPRAANR